MTLTLELPPALELKLSREAETRGVSVERAAEEVLWDRLGMSDPDPDHMSFIKRIADRAKDIPADELERIPKQGSLDVDSYLNAKVGL